MTTLEKMLSALHAAFKEAHWRSAKTNKGLARTIIALLEGFE